MPFADELLSIDTAHGLHRAIREVAPRADLSELAIAAERIAPLSLRERADLLRDALLVGLPGDYKTFSRTIRDAARTPDFAGWLIWPVTGAVAEKAVQSGTESDFDDAMALMAELTGLLTSEFAIRVLLRHDLRRAIGIIADWTRSEDPAIRRLASEGTRPYLPWSTRVPGIIAAPGITIPILDDLYRDPSEDVRRSVANHLNDLSRHAGDLAADTAARWAARPDSNTDRVVRHGLRTLVKQGHPGALGLLGFPPATVDVDGPTLDRESVPFGGSVRFRARIRNDGATEARLVIDYVVHHVKANGTRSAKTFKLATRVLAPGEVTDIEREHSFRSISTRRYYPGTHVIELQVNGVRTGGVEFELMPDRASGD
jgi:3-methyladenine DNA glycosylase AlkC